MRDNDQHIDSLKQQCLSLIDLRLVISVGRLDDHFSSELFGALHEKIAVLLPSLFLQRIHRKADL